MPHLSESGVVREGEGESGGQQLAPAPAPASGTEVTCDNVTQRCSRIGFTI